MERPIRFFHPVDVRSRASEGKTFERRSKQLEMIEAAKTGFFVAKAQSGGQEAVMNSKQQFDYLESLEAPTTEPRMGPLPRLKRYTDKQPAQMQRIGQKLGLLGFPERELLNISYTLVNTPETIEALFGIVQEIQTRTEFEEKYQQLFPR